MASHRLCAHACTLTTRVRGCKPHNDHIEFTTTTSFTRYYCSHRDRIHNSLNQRKNSVCCVRGYPRSGWGEHMGGFKWAGGPLQTAQVLAVLPFDYGSTAPSARIINRQQHRMEIKARSRSGSIDGIAHRRTQRHAPVRRAMSALAMYNGVSGQPFEPMREDRRIFSSSIEQAAKDRKAH